MDGCEGRPPTCGIGQVQVFGAEGLDLGATCRRDGRQPWNKTVEWCCDRAPTQCVAGVASKRDGVWFPAGG